MGDTLSLVVFMLMLKYAGQFVCQLKHGYELKTIVGRNAILPPQVSPTEMRRTIYDI